MPRPLVRTIVLVLLVGAGLAGAPARRVERRSTYWPSGVLKSSGEYVDGLRQGEYRTWREDGTLYELRHYDRGHESGVQQSWERDGTLFLNYEMRRGRRYGFVNPKPCLPAAIDGTSYRRQLQSPDAKTPASVSAVR